VEIEVRQVKALRDIESLRRHGVALDRRRPRPLGAFGVVKAGASGGAQTLGKTRAHASLLVKRSALCSIQHLGREVFRTGKRGKLAQSCPLSEEVRRREPGPLVDMRRFEKAIHNCCSRN
jgi:hypothetical protein